MIHRDFHPPCDWRKFVEAWDLNAFRDRTTGDADVLFERDTLRSIDGTSSAIANKAYEHHYAAYFQDRWKPTQRISIKAGVRVENNRVFTEDRE